MLDWLKRRSERALVALIVMLLAAGLAFSFPPDVALLFAVDLSTWVEAAVAVYFVAQVTKIRPIIVFLRARLSLRKRRSAREKRTRGIATRREPSNDDDSVPLLGLAA
jgi:hypothetical protein